MSKPIRVERKVFPKKLSSKKYRDALKKAKGKVTGTTHLECSCGGFKFMVGLEKGEYIVKCISCDQEYIL